MVSSKLNISAVLVSFLLVVPALAAPSGAVDAGKALAVENLIPRDYINEVILYHEAKAQAVKRAEYTHAKRALHTLQKRLPVDQHCEQPGHWVARNCLANENPRAYEDECQRPDGTDYEVDGECPENTVCQGIVIPNGRDPRTGEEMIIDDIICAPGTPPRQDNTERGRQYGYRSVAGSSKTQNTAIPVTQDNASASVSAVLLSGDKNFIINPQGTLTANLRGFRLQLCRQNNPGRPTPNNSRQCTPAVENRVRKGQTIDFTYGMNPVQSGFLFYSIV